ncbi:MAG: hypothetical protein U1E59_10135 [Amaricoccus sp.]
MKYNAILPRLLDVAADALFGAGDPDPHVVDVEVGPGRGLRDMAAVGGGFLLLAGPGDNPADACAGWVLLDWDGRARRPGPWRASTSRGWRCGPISAAATTRS